MELKLLNNSKNEIKSPVLNCSCLGLNKIQGIRNMTQAGPPFLVFLFVLTCLSLLSTWIFSVLTEYLNIARCSTAHHADFWRSEIHVCIVVISHTDIIRSQEEGGSARDLQKGRCRPRLSCLLVRPPCRAGKTRKTLSSHKTQQQPRDTHLKEAWQMCVAFHQQVGRALQCTPVKVQHS